MIYVVVCTFIEIVDTLGDYVFSDYRTFKLIPYIMDTMIEFIYGPCIENQQFLGGWKKLMSVINTLMDQKEMGNYSGIHQEAKAQLTILHSCSQVLLAITDIKHEEIAKKTHMLILAEIDIQNLINKMVDIYIYKIGGSEEKKRIYDFDIKCSHFNDKDPSDKESRCIEDEFCQFGHFIPRDKNVIQTGFNIYQILQLLNNTCGDDPRMECFKRNELKYIYLQKEKDDLIKEIAKQQRVTSDKTQDIYNRFNLTESKLLDELIIKCYPETFLAYIEKTASETKDINQTNALMQDMVQARKARSAFDRQQLLEKIRDRLKGQVQRAQASAVEGPEPLADLTLDKSHDQLLPEQLKNQIADEYQAKLEIELKRRHKLEEDRILREVQEQEYQDQVNQYKFYIASNFYEDNIGKVEISNVEGQIITTTFQIPSFVQHLTGVSRDAIPYLINKVSQQEKLEMFVSEINLLQTEMLWQQRLGAFSVAFKLFANQWNTLSWVNFTMICLINIMFISYLKIISDADGNETTGYDMKWQKVLLDGTGYIQTGCAAVVVISYYIEYRANLKYLIQKGKDSKLVSVMDFGMNKGSQGYGKRKAHKMDVKSTSKSLVGTLKQIGKKTMLGRLLYLFGKEAIQFCKSLLYSRDHTRNIIYLWVSVYGSYDDGQLFNALLLLDIINKIKTLNQVLSIFNENKIALISTLALFGVVLYISAFYAFRNFRADYDPNGDADYNMYCETLVQCLATTINYGIRAGGGVGDVLTQRNWDDNDDSDGLYFIRYFFDFMFFMIINIILMNIFFGIIIDSFADKRSHEAEIEEEVHGQCFICGIPKSRFEIENVPWKEHVYQEHNLHSYISFLIYVKNKKLQECTGVEKWVKQCIKNQTIFFFPIQKCLSINHGDELEI